MSKPTAITAVKYLTANTCHELECEVNEYITKGWELKGTIVSDSTSNEASFYIQAVVKAGGVKFRDLLDEAETLYSLGFLLANPKPENPGVIGKWINQTRAALNI